ncbi:MAG: hypothetical protein JW915_25210 [Chitinispirillaceae bacterium]|nr:hypothetical protein [Chitinispirillaceae bacterium]
MVKNFINLMSGYFKLLLLWLLDLMHPFPLEVRYCITDLMAVLTSIICVKKRNVVKKNLLVINRKKVRETDIRAVFKSYGRYWAELPDITSLWIRQFKIICGPDFPPEEKCFLGVTFHIGNFELFGPALFEVTGCDLSVVAERLYPAALFDFFFRIRKRHHIHTIAHDDARKILSVLKEGKPLGVLCDRCIGANGININLFGTNWVVPMSVVKYALSLKIPVYCAYCIQQESVIQLVCKKIDARKSFDTVTAEIAQTLEHAISNYPFLWHNISSVLNLKTVEIKENQ